MEHGGTSEVAITLAFCSRYLNTVSTYTDINTNQYIIIIDNSVANNFVYKLLIVVDLLTSGYEINYLYCYEFAQRKMYKQITQLFIISYTHRN